MPLTDAVNESIEKLRSFLKNKFRIDDKELHCMFCLGGGTSEDPLFHSGCACRPDSGMGTGHIKCFQEFALASFADEKKKKNSFDCGVYPCSNCSQVRCGILFFEMSLILWKLYDPDSLTRQNVENIDQADIMRMALRCLDFALKQGDDFGSAHSHIVYTLLRVKLHAKDLWKKNSCSDITQNTERNYGCLYR